MVEIPIQNIYYLLCYAWDKLDERDLVSVDSKSFKTLPDLFAKVLSNGLSYLLKKGLDRDYVTEEEWYPGIKGKLLLSDTIKHTSFVNGKTRCSYDQLSHDVLHNQILKATIESLLHYDTLDPSIKNELRLISQRFHHVTNIKLQRRHFSQVALHRNNSFYKFLLHVCLAIYDNLILDESTGNWQFKDFFRDEAQMAALFEKFIFNFYKREVSHQYRVEVEIIKWQVEAIGESSLDYLPVMRTDISLTGRTRKIIVDAKYYKEAMVTRYDREKFRSSHWYQMVSYMSNLDERSHQGKSIDGILVYPTVEKSFDQGYKGKNYTLSFKTLNLNDEWQNIHNRLVEIVG